MLYRGADARQFWRRRVRIMNGLSSWTARMSERCWALGPLMRLWAPLHDRGPRFRVGARRGDVGEGPRFSRQRKPSAHYLWASCSARQTGLQRGIEELNRALTIEPEPGRCQRLHGPRSRVCRPSGRSRSFCLQGHAPEPPRSYRRTCRFEHVGEAKACLGEFEQALPWVRRSIDVPQLPLGLLPFGQLSRALGAT